MASTADQSQRDDGYSGGPAVGRRPGVETCQIEHPFTDLPLEPVQMTDVVFIHSNSEFDLQGNNPTIIPFDDQIDLVLTGANAQMGRTGFRCLGAHPQAKRGQGFEEGAEEWSRTLRNACSCEQAVGVHAQQTGCKGGIGEVVFGGGESRAIALALGIHAGSGSMIQSRCKMSL